MNEGMGTPRMMLIAFSVYTRQPGAHMAGVIHFTTSVYKLALSHDRSRWYTRVKQLVSA